jgi:hypothetical protein
MSLIGRAGGDYSGGTEGSFLELDARLSHPRRQASALESFFFDLGACLSYPHRQA